MSLYIQQGYFPFYPGPPYQVLPSSPGITVLCQWAGGSPYVGCIQAWSNILVVIFWKSEVKHIKYAIYHIHYLIFYETRAMFSTILGNNWD